MNAATTETIAVIGAGQAGGWAVQTLRKEGYSGRIVLIGAESHIPYERPPLSKAVLSGEATSESTYLIRREAFDALGIDWRPNVQVTALDAKAQAIELTTGELVAYDKLILCNGGRARPLKVPGADLPGVFMLRNIDDANALAGELVAGRRMVVVGGGWIGLEVAATARQKGMSVAIVEAMPRLCERTVPSEVSARLLALHSAYGVEVLLGTGVEALSRDSDNSLSVMLSDGRRLVCDSVVVGIGLIPNDELARDAGLACDGGVLVDSRCMTSDENIFAAGDVANWHCAWAGRRMRLESWQNAQEQGIAAARSALGLDVDHQPLPWFWSDQYGVNLQIFGMPTPSHRVVERRALDADGWMLFYLDGDAIAAAIGFDMARDLRFARRLIEQRKSVDADRLSDPLIPMSKH